MNRSILAGAAVLTLAVSGAGVAAASGGTQGAQDGGPSASARTTPGVTSCNGGKQKRTLTKTARNPFTYGEGTDALVPGMRVEVKGPRRGSDTLNVAFSGESALLGGDPGPVDWQEVEVLVDGNPIQPFGSSVDPYAFNGSSEYSSHAAQFCTKIGRGTHVVVVRSRLKDTNSNNTLTGWLDDTTLHAVLSE